LNPHVGVGVGKLLIVDVQGSSKVSDMGVMLSLGMTVTLSQRDIVGTAVLWNVVTMTLVGMIVVVAFTFRCIDDVDQSLLVDLHERWEL
jgi:hypothetical protein